MVFVIFFLRNRLVIKFEFIKFKGVFNDEVFNFFKSCVFFLLIIVIILCGLNGL